MTVFATTKQCRVLTTSGWETTSGFAGHKWRWRNPRGGTFGAAISAGAPRAVGPPPHRVSAGAGTGPGLGNNLVVVPTGSGDDADEFIELDHTVIPRDSAVSRVLAELSQCDQEIEHYVQGQCS